MPRKKKSEAPAVATPGPSLRPAQANPVTYEPLPPKREPPAEPPPIEQDQPMTYAQLDAAYISDISMSELQAMRRAALLDMNDLAFGRPINTLERLEDVVELIDLYESVVEKAAKISDLAYQLSIMCEALEKGKVPDDNLMDGIDKIMRKIDPSLYFGR